MSLITDLLEKPSNPSTASRYTVMNGVLYLGAGVLMIAWPGMVETLFRDAPFVGHEGALFRVVGLLLVVVGWLYFFGGRSGSRQPVAASVIDRLVFVPLIFLPLAYAGVFPHVLVTFAIIEPLLGIGAWILLSRKT
jgi:hypothetical protein